MLTTKQAIGLLLERVRKGLIDDMSDKNMRASDKTAASIKPKNGDLDGSLSALRSIGALISGRRPTGSGASRGTPSLYEQIREWIDNKGISPDGDMTKESLAWAITKKIHKSGTRSSRNQAPKLDLNGVVEVSVKESINDVTQAIAAYYKPEIYNALKQALS
jgi:hypothetical protein